MTERQTVSEMLDINSPVIWHNAQDNFTADKSSKMKHTTKYQLSNHLRSGLPFKNISYCNCSVQKSPAQGSFSHCAMITPHKPGAE
jgi:hypothetical protein